MTSPAIERLMRAVPPPALPLDAGSMSAFAQVEASLGLHLPDDYKLLVVSYGDGTWQDFWHLLNPFSRLRYWNLLEQAPRDDASGNTVLSAERYIQLRHADYPHAIWPEPGGILPWAGTDNGGRFFWLTTGEPNQWPTIYYPDRSPDFTRYDLPVGQIVAGAVLGELPIFAEPFGPEYEYGSADSFVPLATNR